MAYVKFDTVRPLNVGAVLQIIVDHKGRVSERVGTLSSYVKDVKGTTYYFEHSPLLWVPEEAKVHIYVHAEVNGE